MLKFIRCSFPAFVVLMLCVPVTGAYASAESTKKTTQEILVHKMGEEALKELVGKKVSKEQRNKHMRKLLNKYFDLTAIGKFALGHNWRKADSKQQKEYLDLFKKMVVSTYADRFKEYSGEEFKVTGSKSLNKRDTIVHSKIIPKDGPKLVIDWRIRNKNGKYRVIDVIIEGVSMGVTQRSEFASIIQKGGGEVDVLISSLRQ